MNIRFIESRYQKLPKQPLEIKLFLGSPILLPKHPIHLDALLTNILAREHFGYDPDRWQNEQLMVDLPLPLQREKGIWKASAAFHSPLAKEKIDFWVKRTVDDFSGYKEDQGVIWPAGVLGFTEPTPSKKREITFEHATGPANESNKKGFKSYYENRNLLIAEYLIFHAVGHKQEIERLLKKLSSVGKKTGIGFGQITTFTVAEVDEDYSFFMPNGEVTRALPITEFPNLKGGVVATRIKPPYWAVKDLMVCYSPSLVPEWVNDQRYLCNNGWFDEFEDRVEGFFD